MQYGANLPLEVKTLRKERASCSFVMVSSVSGLVDFYERVITFFRMSASVNDSFVGEKKEESRTLTITTIKINFGIIFLLDRNINKS